MSAPEDANERRRQAAAINASGPRRGYVGRSARRRRKDIGSPEDAVLVEVTGRQRRQPAHIDDERAWAHHQTGCIRGIPLRGLVENVVLRRRRHVMPRVPLVTGHHDLPRVRRVPRHRARSSRLHERQIREGKQGSEGG